MSPRSRGRFPQNDSLSRRPPMAPEPTSARWNGRVRKGALYLGIAGGGSRCRARIEDEYGAALGEGSSGPATTRLGIDQAWRSILQACAAAAEQAGIAREDFARIHAGIGLAGLGRRGAQAALEQIAHPFASVRFISDGLAACLGAHGGADGAIVVAGTGSIGVGLIGGRELRFGRYGVPISDGGIGADIGFHANKLPVCAADERRHTPPPPRAGPVAF